jgi:tRNA1Val (adenine37-N6)-methyltransferase
MNRLSEDTFFNGKLKVRQQRQGYRFSVDAVILAHHVHPAPGQTVLDLGTGCGIIPLILAYRFPQARYFGIEIQKELAETAMANVKLNGLEDRIRIVCADMRNLPDTTLPNPVDWVVSNPPYHRSQTGRLNPDRQRALARHEIAVTLPEIVATGRKVLKNGGRFAVIYTAERMVEFLQQLTAAGIAPKTCRMIHSGRRTRAKLMLIEGVRGAQPGLVVAPPLILYEEDGVYTEEVQAMFLS